MKAARHALLSLLVIGTAAAQEKPPGDKPRGGGEGRPNRERQGGGRMADSWKKADTNGDGFISIEEFAAMERPGRLPEEKRMEIFRRFDKNGDGRIGPGEMPKRPQGGGMPPLEQVDADKDGRIVFAEFQKLGFVAKLPEERQRALFARMDRDGDGALTPKDRPPGGGPGRDARRDGRGRGNPHDLIRHLDRDGDGALSFEEFRQAGFLKDRSEDEQEEQFEAMDRNGDLKIDATDLPPPPGEKKPKPEKPAEGA